MKDKSLVNVFYFFTKSYFNLVVKEAEFLCKV